MSKHVFLIDEFIAEEISKGNITREKFTKEKRLIKLHGHCQQKAISSIAASVKMLSLPENYSVETIPSGCCGMAGSFGFEKEHYDLSMQIAELVLLPTVRKQDARNADSRAGHELQAPDQRWLRAKSVAYGGDFVPGAWYDRKGES
jgi:hypothetical protein